MIELTEKQIEEIRSLTQQRKWIRDKLDVLKSNRTSFDHVHIRFDADGGTLEMKQGDRGGLLGDLLAAFETHLNEQDCSLTGKLAELGVRVS
ncbi:hypothetical protein [Methylorubrum extorquens]|uniref:hypothetical protein n=1 Tax=Methylorubrum extorquens TaxID=408 RepID=UPI0020A09C0C|nr:hypothetical protein [Methylorubrum extorquens]MCP1539996.1 hypothetical protein [Methylorubrum extorquens]